MILKKEQNKTLLYWLVDFFRSRKIITSSFFLLVLAILIFFSGALTYRHWLLSRLGVDVIKPALKVGLRLPVNYFLGLFSNPEKIYIDIGFKDWQKIVQGRNIALEKGFLPEESKEEVSATLTHNNKKMPIKIRLKGDDSDHLNGEKWSFRIKISGNDSFLNMRRFSIQDPARRSYIFEWLFHQFLKKEGLLYLDYDFVDVTLNGKHKGVYAIEEFFSERAIVHNNLPVGPILKINDILYFSFLRREDEKDIISARLPKDPLSEIYASVPIESFEPAKWTDPALKEEYKMFQDAKDLLESFRRKRLKASEVFDVRKTAKFFAIIDLTVAFHATTWSNVRWYYNPLTFRLEFLGYDAEIPAGESMRFLSGYQGIEERPGGAAADDLRYAVFADPVIYEEYIKQLERISQPSYLDNFFSEIKENLNKKLSIIYRDEPYYFFDKNWLYANRDYIEKALHPVEGEGLKAYFKQYDDNAKIITVQAGNTLSLSIEILNIQSGDILFKPLNTANILDGRKTAIPIDFKDVEFAISSSFKLSDDAIHSLSLNYKIRGGSNVMTEKIMPWPLLSDTEEIERIKNRQNPNAYLFDFLITDTANKIIFVKKGKWTIEKDLVIPSAYTFLAAAGAEIDIINSARIVSYSPLKFIGSGDSPMKIVSSDKTSKGIWIYAPEKSRLDNVVIANNLVNFYESPAFINKVYFLGSSSYDDTLHIIRSDFELSDSFFGNVSGDALDVDYGKGLILRTSFNNSGNDAMDFSGSVISIKDSRIQNAEDKGISAGEGSRIEAENLTIIDSNICLASKDSSEVNIKNMKLENCKVGVTAFQKKPEFGPGKATISNLTIKNTASEFLVEKGSSVELDGRPVKAEETNLKEKFYEK